MSIFDHLFDSEYKQRVDIESLKRGAQERRRARSRDRQQLDDQQKRIEELEDQVGELALLCRSLLTVLREDGTVEPERFQQVMEKIDAEDGVVDGKVTRSPPPDDPQIMPEIRTWPKDERMQ